MFPRAAVCWVVSKNAKFECSASWQRKDQMNSVDLELYREVFS